MKFILLTFSTLLFLSCSETVKNENSTSQNEINTDYPESYGDLRDFPTVATQENQDTLIKEMTRDNCVYPKAAGIAGEYTYEYACFDRLSNLISEREIFQLIEHPNANVRLYAYYWLDDTKSEYLDSANIILKEDNSRVWTLKGASKEHIKLSDLVAMKPIDKLKEQENYNENMAAETKQK